MGRKSKVRFNPLKQWTFEKVTLGQMEEAQGRIIFHWPPIDKVMRDVLLW